MRALVLAAAVAAGPALADAIYAGPAGYIRLADAPCTHDKVLPLLKPEWAPKFRQGWMAHKGRQLQLCWILDGDSVFVVDEDHDAGRLPVAKFKRDEGV